MEKIVNLTEPLWELPGFLDSLIGNYKVKESYIFYNGIRRYSKFNIRLLILKMIYLRNWLDHDLIQNNLILASHC